MILTVIKDTLNSRKTTYKTDFTPFNVACAVYSICLMDHQFEASLGFMETESHFCYVEKATLIEIENSIIETCRHLDSDYPSTDEIDFIKSQYEDHLRDLHKDDEIIDF